MLSEISRCILQADVIIFAVMKGEFSDKFVAYCTALWKEPYHLLIRDTLHEWFLVKFCGEN
jgi:hypothetical protein